MPVALSVRQPWAALLAAGVKTVEVRTWPTRRRGPVLIHAGRVADDRPEAWALVTDPAVFELARLRGGVIGAAELTDCRTYDTVEAFAADATAHLNDPAWFTPPRLYGFVFAAARVVSFAPYPGRTLFFPVEEYSGGAMTAARVFASPLVGEVAAERERGGGWGDGPGEQAPPPHGAAGPPPPPGGGGGGRAMTNFRKNDFRKNNLVPIICQV
ncbi:MAG: ASCH domain-containing protein [Gemmataceae bacterium]|nr:ASCH domain-containing protein [Gemmataceae bacterium]